MIERFGHGVYCCSTRKKILSRSVLYMIKCSLLLAYFSAKFLPFYRGSKPFAETANEKRAIT